MRARETGLVFTHAYEGGHPDHDATTFAVHVAARLVARAGGIAPLVLEFPLYRAVDGSMAAQCFVPSDAAREVALPLSPRSRARKRLMLACHATQARTLARFSVEVERFRRAPAYDFTALPNDGVLYYERFDWGLDGREWIVLVKAALAAFDLSPCP
jgi:LmbE family N-acetylglucosaminyl deacetylase